MNKHAGQRVWWCEHDDCIESNEWFHTELAMRAHCVDAHGAAAAEVPPTSPILPPPSGEEELVIISPPPPFAESR